MPNIYSNISRKGVYWAKYNHTFTIINKNKNKLLVLLAAIRLYVTNLPYSTSKTPEAS